MLLIDARLFLLLLQQPTAAANAAALERRPISYSVVAFSLRACQEARVEDFGGKKLAGRVIDK
jgi:hypothetical protein